AWYQRWWLWVILLIILIIIVAAVGTGLSGNSDEIATEQIAVVDDNGVLNFSDLAQGENADFGTYVLTANDAEYSDGYLVVQYVLTATGYFEFDPESFEATT
ncbi:MAG: hypothetical protein LUB61_07555, partial [Eggerthellaceae bacterium]|nr:hypothetical protein [Eggerthellaceae bacterium]